jgi:hypothetical protein
MSEYLATFVTLPADVRTLLETGLRTIFRVEEVDGSLRVTTHCLYPSNGFVRVTFRGGVHSMVASDEGEALGEALAAGIELRDPDKILGPFVRARGLSLRNGIIFTDRFPPDAAPVALSHIANAAKEAAYWLYEHGGLKRKRDFKALLNSFLADKFRGQVAEARLLGKSHKLHRFSNVVSFANGRRLIIDAASFDPSSINARVVANLDVRALNDPKIEQRIIFDDEERWTSADLSLLQVGATVVPFSRSQEVITRVADGLREAA